MARSDRLPPAVRRAIDGLARGDFEELLADARAEARAEVKAVLKDAYSKALLEQAEALLADSKREPEPAPAPEPAAVTDSGEGLWVYCVVPAERELPSGLSGVSPQGTPRLVAAAGVAALVSEVPLSEFGEIALRENLNDLAWLERTAWAHEAVLDAMLADGALVPMRVCTIYRGEQQVAAMLEDSARLLLDALDELAGKAEWAVKLVVDRARLEASVRDSSEEARGLAGEVAGKSEGGAYVARKKLDALVREQAEGRLGEVVRETHVRLEEWASGSAVLPAQNRELSGHEGEMVFNCAYLVENERAEAFAGLVGELEAQHGALGISFLVTGPWPAYNFAGASAAGEVRR